MENPFEIMTQEIEGLRKDIAKLHSLLENPAPAPLKDANKLLTGDEVCERLKISRVTLWNWDKKEITKPIYIGGGLKRYRLADIDALQK
jgi:predicted DNA-binding transcriptional regulator AlpA